MYDDKDPFAKPRDTTELAIKLGVAVFLAIVAAMVIRQAYVNWVINQAVQQFQNSMAQISVQSQEQLAAVRTRQIQEQRLAMQLKIMADERLRAGQAEQMAREQREMEIAAAKEAAWKSYYKPRQECAESNTGRDFVECGNQYRRAKVQFEKIWEAKLNSQ